MDAPASTCRPGGPSLPVPRSAGGRGTADASRLALTICLLVVIVAALAPFLPTLGNELVWDDHILLENNPALLKPFSSFRHMIVMNDQQTPYYRPLSVFWWSAERVLLGLGARGLHLANMLLHAGAALLVLLISLRWLPPLPALLGSVLFAVHPVQVEPVAFASAGGTELLPAVLFLGAIWVLLPRGDRPGEPGCPARKRLWVSAGLYLCAMLSKEAAVGMPLVAAIVLFARRPRCERDWRGVACRMAPYAFAALAYAALRAGAMLSRHWLPAQTTNPSAAWQVPAWMFASLKALLSMQRLQPYHELTPLSAAEHVLLLVLVAAVALFVVLVGRARRWDLPVLLGLGLVLVPLVPTAPLLPRAGALVAARFLYLPSAGLALLAGCALAEVGRRFPGKSRWAVFAAFACVMVWAGGVTSSRTGDWQDDRTLVSRALARDPGSRMLLLMRGYQHLKEKEPREAERFLKASLALDPGQWQAKVYLGQSYQAQGRLEEAEALYRTLLTEAPSAAAAAWFGLGTIRMQTGRDGDGEREFLQAVRINPAMVNAYLNLGLIAYQRRDLDQTARFLEAGLELDPSNPHILNGLGMTARDRGDYREARSYLRRALAVQPSLESARRALASLPPDPP